jgi:glycosyltransferase involved in cell wall biosynthesis
MSTTKSLGIIISTPGRASLYRTLHSIFYQQAPVEDVLIVGDGHHEGTSDLVCLLADSGYPVRYIATEKTRDWGHSQLNYALKHVRGDYVVVQDDDDIFLPRALNEMARLVSEFESPRVLMGRIKTPNHGLLWQQAGPKAVLDGHCMVAPNDKRRLGWFDPAYNGDQCFIHTTVRNYKNISWADRVWTLARPHWKLWPSQMLEVPSGVWAVDFYRSDDIGPFATPGISRYGRIATLASSSDGDRHMVRATRREETPTIEEWREIAEYAVWAGQGKDCWLRIVDADEPLLEQALLVANYKEHVRTDDFVEYTHDWPADFWPVKAPFTHLVDALGNEVPDWRSDCWGGKAVDDGKV